MVGKGTRVREQSDSIVLLSILSTASVLCVGGGHSFRESGDELQGCAVQQYFHMIPTIPTCVVPRPALH